MPNNRTIFIVYELRHPDGRPFYVGKGKRRRPQDHLGGRTNPHCARTIAAIRRNGKEPIVAIVFETDDEGAAFAEEIRLIALYGREHLTNLTDGGEGFRGGRHTTESRASMSKANKGKVVSAETRMKMSLARRNMPARTFSEKARANMSAARRGEKRKPLTAETRAKISKSLTGRALTADHRAAIAKGQLGKPGHPCDDMCRQKISNANRGRIPWNKGLCSDHVPEILPDIPDG